jgi:acyl-CoA dehydrogenase
MFDLRPTDRALEIAERMRAFLDEAVFPVEEDIRSRGTSAEITGFHPPLVPQLADEAKARGLWNCLLRGEPWGTNMGYLEMAPIAELTGRSWLVPRAINWCGPDHGNTDLLIGYGNEVQQRTWLPGLLDATVGTCFAMTEPAVASSDASNIETTIVREGDSFVINGRKWWISAGDQPRTQLAVVLGVSNPEAPPHARHSMVLVPMDTTGVTVERSLTVFNFADAAGQLLFDNVRVPVCNLLGREGAGFGIAQERLAPARVYHAMRMVGMAEQALDLMVARAKSRVVFGRPIGDHGMAQKDIALSRIDIDMARLHVLAAAAAIDSAGPRAAMNAIAQVKVAAPAMALRVIDRAIQMHGGAGLSSDFPLAWMYAMARTVRIADGPDEVHLRSIARREVRGG